MWNHRMHPGDSSTRGKKKRKGGRGVKGGGRKEGEEKGQIIRLEQN